MKNKDIQDTKRLISKFADDETHAILKSPVALEAEMRSPKCNDEVTNVTFTL